MNTENIKTLKIHKLSQEQYERELLAGNIDPNALYLTPDEGVDLSDYATIAQLEEKESAIYKQAEAPEDAPDGAMWIDTDEENESNIIPEFNLIEMGLPVIPLNGTEVSRGADTTAILAALSKGAIKIGFSVDAGAFGIQTFTDTANGLKFADDSYLISKCVPIINTVYLYEIWVESDGIYAAVNELQKVLPGGSSTAYVVPEFNLAEMGLPAIPEDGSYVSVNVDTTALCEALDKGMVKIRCDISPINGDISYFTDIVTGMNFSGYWLITRSVAFEGVYHCYSIWVSDSAIYANALSTQMALPEWNGGSY